MNDLKISNHNNISLKQSLFGSRYRADNILSNFLLKNFK